MQKLEPVKNGIIFEFFDDSTQTRFINKTNSGILTTSSASDQSNVDRWGKVISIGPDVFHSKVDDWILVESGYWTPSFMHAGQKLWKTDESHVLLVSDQPYSIY